MKAAIDVRNREEADRVKRALGKQDVLSFVNIVGALEELPPHEMRRVLSWVIERYADAEHHSAMASSAMDLPASLATR